MPGPVVSGNVIGKKLRCTISASDSVAAFSAATACTSSSSVWCSMCQAVAATSRPPPMRTTGIEMPNSAST